MIEYIILTALFFCSLRLIIGPTIYDRVVALDTFLVLVIALLSLWAQGEEMLLDIAIVFAGLSFGATLIFSKYMRGEEIWS